jgi:hypothetical protein
VSQEGVTFLGTFNLSADTISQNHGWYKLGGVEPVSCGEDCYWILIGHFTVTQGAEFSGGLRILGDGIDEYATFSSEE